MTRHSRTVLTAAALIVSAATVAAWHTGTVLGARHRQSFVTVAASPLTSPSPIVPSKSDEPSTVPDSYPDSSATIGQTVSASGVSVKVESVKYDPCSGKYNEAGLGNTYAVIRVSLHNRTYPGSADYGAYSWELDYDTSSAWDSPSRVSISPCHRNTGSQPFLTKGARVTTLLEFEIPRDATNQVLRWDGLRAFDSGPVVTISLGR